MNLDTLPRIVRPEDAAGAAIRNGGEPLSQALEDWLLERCSRRGPYRIEAIIVADPPTTLSALLDLTGGAASETRGGSIRDHAGALVGQRIPVSGQHSERTVWSGPAANAIYRAWHDSIHVLLGAPMDLAGELRVARATILEARQTGVDETGQRILAAETQGMALYADRYGTFPLEQRAFVADALELGLDLAIDRGPRAYGASAIG